MDLTIEIEREDDGRWIVEVINSYSEARTMNPENYHPIFDAGIDALDRVSEAAPFTPRPARTRV